MGADPDLGQQITQFTRCIVERDTGLAETVLDDDYALVLVQPSPVVMPREEWLAVLEDYRTEEYDVQEQLVDVDGSTACVIQRVRIEATVLGTDRSGLFVVSDIWRQRDDGWRVWRRHSTPLSAGAMPRADTD